MARTLKLTLQNYQQHPGPRQGLPLSSSASRTVPLNYRPECLHHSRQQALVPRVLLGRTTFPIDGHWPTPYSSLPKGTVLILPASPSSPRMPPWLFFSSYPRSLRIPQSWALTSLQLPASPPHTHTLSLLEGGCSIQKHPSLWCNPSLLLIPINALIWLHS